MGEVSITKTTNGIKEGLIKAINLIGGFSQHIDHNDIIMLKPNLNGLDGTDGFTNIYLVESLIQLLFDYNVKKVFIAESTFGDAFNTDRLFNKTGYVELANKYNIDLVNLNASKPVEVAVKDPLVLDKLQIAEEVFEADKIINLPNMKVHYAVGITLALKNLKGILVGDEKKRFHKIGLEKAIVDLNNTIKVDLNIIDAIECMERMGPFGGDKVDMNLIIAGSEIAEVDYTGCVIMDHELDDVRHIKQYIENNNIDLNGIKLLGENIEDVKYPFQKVKFENIVPEEFNIKNINACSSCENAFLLSCTFLENSPSENIEIYMGSLNDLNNDSEILKIAFGNCCEDNSRYNFRIKGCPPLPFKLNMTLKKNNKVRQISEP